MAVRKAVANGNWSSTSTWDGGTLPASTDDVYANNFTVSVDQSITVNLLSSAAQTGITAGGGFVVTAAATLTIASNIVAGATGALILVDAGPSAVTISVPTATGGSSSGSCIVTDPDYYGTLTVNGNITGGGGGYGLYVQGTSLTYVNGNVTAGAGANGIYCDGYGVGLYITGNLVATATKCVFVASADSVVTITGDITGGSANGAYGFHSTNAATQITIEGNIHGGSALSAWGVFGTRGAWTIRGSFRPGNYSANPAGAPAMYCVGDASYNFAMRISGDIYVGGVSPSTGPAGLFPIQGNWTVIDGEDLLVHALNDSAFPLSNEGTEVTIGGGGGGGPTVPTSGVLWPPRYY